MNTRIVCNRLKTVASAALLGSAMVGTVLSFWPIASSFDLRSVGAVLAGGFTAIKVFNLA